FLELSTLKKLHHFQNNFDAEWLNGISFVLQVSLYNGGFYNPYGSRTFIDDDTASVASSGCASRGRRDSVVSVFACKRI
ncbi:LRRFIP2, partial [Cervus elaphus hippelaphus]